MQKHALSLAILIACSYSFIACDAPKTDETKAPAKRIPVRSGSANNLDDLLGTRPSKAGFDAIIAENSCVIVDFYADWCGPCKKLSPIIQKLAGEYKSVIFLKINTETQEDLASIFSVRSIPTLLYFKNGRQVKRTSNQSEKEMRSTIESLFN